VQVLNNFCLHSPELALNDVNHTRVIGGGELCGKADAVPALPPAFRSSAAFRN
jgi:hypothetical protein